MNTLLILDTETTGLPNGASKPAQVIQIGAILVTWPGIQEISRFSVRLRFAPSYFAWDPAAQEVHGIPLAEAKLEAPIADGLLAFREYIEPEARGHCMVAGWNPAFDVAAITRTVETLDPLLPHDIAEVVRGIPGALGYRHIDLQTLGAVLFGLNGSKAACAWLKHARQHHDALDDCQWCLELLRRVQALAHPRLNKALATAARFIRRS